MERNEIKNMITEFIELGNSRLLWISNGVNATNIGERKAKNDPTWSIPNNRKITDKIIEIIGIAVIFLSNIFLV